MNSTKPALPDDLARAHIMSLYSAVAPKLKWLLSVVRRTAKPPVVPMWTTADVADRLQVHPDSVRRWRVTGDGPPFIKLPKGGVRYDPAKVNEWIEAQARTSTSEE